MFDWHAVYKGLGLVAVGLLGVIDVTLEVSSLKDSPVDLVDVVEESEELQSAGKRADLRTRLPRRGLRAPEARIP